MDLHANLTLLREFLKDPLQHAWTLQGFGMLRLYVPNTDKAMRLHLWERQARVKDVSDIHDHPWDFESQVLMGRITNQVYEISDHEPSHTEHRIKCGHGAAVCAGSTRDVCLRTSSLFTVHPGQHYFQAAAEIHSTNFEDTTVTMVRRIFSREDTEHALVYTPKGTPWISAEPRPATPTEILRITDKVLKKMR